MSTVHDKLILDMGGDAQRKLDALEKQLRETGQAADKTADKIDKVGSGGGGPSGGLGLEVGNAASGAAIGAIGAAIGIAVGAYMKLGEIVTSSMALVVEKTAAAKAASEELARSWEDMQLALGRAILGPDGGASLLEGLANVVGQVTASIQRHSAAIGSAFDTALTIGKGLAFVLSVTLQAALTPLALLIDGVVIVAKSLYAGFLGLKAAALIAAEGIGEAANAAGLMSDEDLADLQKATDAAAKEFDDFRITTAGATEGLWAAGEAIRDVGNAAETIGRKIDPLETFLSGVATKALTARKALEDMLALSPEELGYLRELNQQTREYQQSLAALQGIGLEAPKATGGGGGARVQSNADAGIQAVARGARLREEGERLAAVAELEAAQAFDEAGAAYQRGIEATDADLRAATARFKAVQEGQEHLAMGERATAEASLVNGAFQSMASSAVGLTGALVDMSVAFSRGELSGRDFGAAMLSQLGGIFQQIGGGLLLAGLGLEGLFSGNVTGAIAWGAGLLAIGLAMSAGGGLLKSGGGAPSSSGGGGGGEVRRMAREAFQTRSQDREERTIVVNLGTREIYRELDDGFRRRSLGRG